jgi:hypothetical protein
MKEAKAAEKEKRRRKTRNHPTS